MRKIVDGRISTDQLAPLLQEQRFVAVNSVVSAITFPRAYSTTPSVMATPGPGVDWVRVTRIYPDSFEWVANVAGGSASWRAYGAR